MKIEIRKFGKILVSRPAGKEAFLVFKAYMKPKTQDESFELDFSGVQVLAPSWADEFISGLREAFPSHLLVFLPSKNLSVIESLKILNPGSS